MADRESERDKRRGSSERASGLLERMTLREKVAQLGGVWAASIIEGDHFSEASAKQELAHGTGHVTRIGASTLLRPRQSAEVVNGIQRYLLENTRLGIPAIIHEESCAGYLARDATQFPQAIGLASTWQPELIERVGQVIREQMRAVGARQTLAPVLDIARDPRWGRVEETFGEDPHLASRMGVAYVRGVQGDSLAEGVAATAKHFMGYGASEAGLNWAPTQLPRRELLERILPPFEAAIREADLASLMNGYQEIDGIPCGASRWLLDELLRGELGFDGVVVADYFTVSCLLSYHRVAADKAEAAARCLEAGLDVELPMLDCYGEPLLQAIESGRIDPEFVDRSVERVLRLKFELGLFENPYVDADAAPAVFDTREQRELARQVARKSIVLLKNEGGLLPLDRSVARLALIGPSGESIRLLQGDYSYPTHLEIIFGPVREGEEEAAKSEDTRSELLPGQRADNRDLLACFPPTVSVLAGIRAAVSPETRVEVARGCDIDSSSTEEFGEAVALASACDVAVVAVGGRSGLIRGCTSGEANDRANIGLPGVQAELIRAIAASGTPTVVVLINGRPLALADFFDDVPAILEAWLPGEEGGNALADILFGAESPAGRLPVTLPRTAGQLPLYYNHKPSGGRSQFHGDYADLSCQPLLPFGHGLSYTRFEYSNLVLSDSEVVADDRLTISAQIRNAGGRAADEVVQLYVNDRVASVTRPVKQLEGFVRITLEPGESRRVIFRLDMRRLAFYDCDMRYRVEPGEIAVMLGSSSEDIRLEGVVALVGEACEVRRADIAPTQVELE